MGRLTDKLNQSGGTGRLSQKIFQQKEEQKLKDLETQKQGEEANKFLALPWYKQIITKEYRKEVPGAIAEVAYKTPAKFITSATEVPKTFMTGKATQKEYKLPGLTPFKSYISEAETRAGKIIEGEKPLYTAMTPFVSVPLAGLETAGILKGVFGDVAITGAKAGIYQKGLVQKGFEKGQDILGQMKSKQQLKDALDITKSVLNKKEKIAAIEKAGRPGGAKEGWFGKIKKSPSQQDIDIADSVKDVVGKNKSIVNNTKAINQKIVDTSEEVEKFLTQNPGTGEIGDTIDNIKPPLSVKSDTTLRNTFENVKNAAKQIFSKAEDNLDLWKKRIEFDNMIEKEFGGTIWNPEKNSAVKTAVSEIRRAINGKIASSIENAPKEFLEQMKLLSSMYSARWNIGETFYGLLDKNFFQTFTKLHPLWTKTIKTGGVLAGIGLGSKLLKFGGE